MLTRFKFLEIDYGGGLVEGSDFVAGEFEESVE